MGAAAGVGLGQPPPFGMVGEDPFGSHRFVDADHVAVDGVWGVGLDGV